MNRRRLLEDLEWRFFLKVRIGAAWLDWRLWWNRATRRRRIQGTSLALGEQQELFA